MVAFQNKHSYTPQQILKINKSSELEPWHQIWQKLPIQQMTMQQIFIACSFVTLFPFMRNTFVGTFAIGYFCGQFPLFCRRLTCSDQAHGDRIYNQAVSNGSLWGTSRECDRLFLKNLSFVAEIRLKGCSYFTRFHTFAGISRFLMSL